MEVGSEHIIKELFLTSGFSTWVNMVPHSEIGKNRTRMFGVGKNTLL
jgi:hypothetical protein